MCPWASALGSVVLGSVQALVRFEVRVEASKGLVDYEGSAQSGFCLLLPALAAEGLRCTRVSDVPGSCLPAHKLRQEALTPKPLNP